jgi:hypothetical protein
MAAVSVQSPGDVMASSNCEAGRGRRTVLSPADFAGDSLRRQMVTTQLNAVSGWGAGSICYIIIIWSPLAPFALLVWLFSSANSSLCCVVAVLRCAVAVAWCLDGPAGQLQLHPHTLLE